MVNLIGCIVQIFMRSTSIISRLTAQGTWECHAMPKRKSGDGSRPKDSKAAKFRVKSEVDDLSGYDYVKKLDEWLFPACSILFMSCCGSF